MKNINKGLLLAVGAIVLCVIATIAFILTSESNNISGKNDVSAGSDNLVEVSKKTYDNSKVTGSEVISAINKYSSNDEVAVRIIHKNGNIDLYGVTGVAYCANEIDRINKYETVIEKVTSKDYDDTLDSNNSLYINPGSTFKSSIRYNNDDVVTLITFGQEGSNESLVDYRHKEPLSSSDENYNGGAGSNNYARPDNSSTITKPGTGSSGGSDSTVEVPSTKKYTINYELNGGTLEKGISSYTENDEVVLPIPTKEDTDFLGWYTEDTFTNKVTKIEKGSTGDKTFYAKWGKLTAFAVYSEDEHTLKFYNRDVVPKVGANFDSSIVTKVYTGFDKTSFSSATGRPWHYIKSDVYEVEVVDELRPISIAYWFSDFSACSMFNLSKIDTSCVTSLTETFKGVCKGANDLDIVGLDTWDISNVKYMVNTFYRCGPSGSRSISIDGIDTWDVSNVTDFGSCFEEFMYYATSYTMPDLSTWNVSSGKAFDRMFFNTSYNATSFELDLSNWNVSNGIDFRYMFFQSGYNSAIWSIGDLSKWKTSKATNMRGMFKLAGRASKTWNIGDISKWDVSNVNNFSEMFYYAFDNTGTASWDLTTWDVSSATDMSYMFADFGGNSKTIYLDLTGWDVSNVKDMSYMFYSVGGGYHAKVTLKGLDTWDVSRVVKFDSTFRLFCNKASSITFCDISKWDTKSATNMYYMFYNTYEGCYTCNPKYIDCSKWDVSNVTNYSSFRYEWGSGVIKKPSFN